LIAAIETGDVRLEAVERILDEVFLDAGRSVAEVVERYRKRPDDAEEFETALGEVLRDRAQLDGKPVDAIVRWGMGRLMARFLGRLDPAVVHERLVKALGETGLEVEA
jgi:Glu-tRNA(Gln) amidotransferase subunit E-like FAD-binding protein